MDKILSDTIVHYSTEDKFLDEIQTKVLRVFFLVIHNIQEDNLRENHTLFPMVQEILTETSRLRTLKIITSNLNEIVSS
jgi:hypothetical protein